MTRGFVRRSVLAALPLVSTSSWAAARGDAGLVVARSDAGLVAPPGKESARVYATCIERIPEGKEPPNITESMPGRAKSGWATTLRVTVEHGRAETVLPNGFRVQLGSDAHQALENEGFVLPDRDGGAGPVKRVSVEGDRATTELAISFVPLPDEPGRHELTLPPLPIAVERASGDVITLCTTPHRITVEDPTANTPNADPKDNPAPRPQREVWTAAKHATLVALAALIAGALAAWLVGWWRRRPKPEPPAPPPRPPWEVALEELAAIRRAGLFDEERYPEHFARVSATVRKYLGNRYGFDGLESTTREILGVLRNLAPPPPVLAEIEQFLRQADLVKFARLTPTEEECTAALEQGEHIVHSTIPPRPTEKPRRAPPEQERAT